jgi:phage FluMu protein Com
MTNEQETYWLFWRKYALGDLTVPSCFGCGQLTQSAGIRHLEVRGVVLCNRCTIAVQNAASQADTKAKCPDCGVEYVKGARHFSECRSKPGFPVDASAKP